jgi:hypothetical protein
MSQFNLRFLIAIPIIILLAYFIGQSVSASPFIVITIVMSIVSAILTFQNPENGLIFLVYSMLLSPEIPIGNVPGRPVAIRVDDVLIIIVFVAWLAHISVQKDWKGFLITPFDKLLIGLTALYIVSTSWGIFEGRINPLKGFFYALKYIEYFILYWITVNVLVTESVINRSMRAGLITCLIVTVYVYAMMPSHMRASAPFDKVGGEPASLGGYYLIIFSILISLLLHADTTASVIIPAIVLLCVFAPFVRTLSRASYLAIVPLTLSILFFTKKRKVMYALILIGSVIFLPIIAPTLTNDAMKRINETFTADSSGSYKSVNVSVGRRITDQSALDRIFSWKMVAREKLMRSPFTFLFGNGVTGVGFIDGQFFSNLGEIGVIGILMFYGLIIKIFLFAKRVYMESSRPMAQGLSLALMATVVGLLTQSISTNTFIIVRIMEPFWFLTGLVVAIHTLQEQPATTQTDRAPA